VSFLPPEGTALLRSLGAGTTFEVALVSRGELACVCKRLRSRMLTEPRAHSALEREARVLAMGQLGCVPRLLGTGADAAGPYLLESCISGASLRELVEGWLERGKLLPSDLLHFLIRRSFEALAELHALGDEQGPLELVHGDLGPDHVLLDTEGQIYFVDFGQARWRGMPSVPEPGERGTLPYVAPELARGETVAEQRSDVFALAATLGYAALGRPPCTEEALPARLIEISERGVELGAIEASQLLGTVAKDVLLRALGFDPHARLGSAERVCSELAR